MSIRGVACALAVMALSASAPACAAAVVEPGDAAPPVAAGNTDCPPSADAPTREEVLAGMRAAVDSGVLWKAARNGRTVYLYGTIHVAQRAWMFPGPHVMRAVLASDTIALELDPTDPDIVARLQKAILRRADAPALPAVLQRRLQAQMAAACVDAGKLDALRPEMQAVSVEVLEGREFGLYPDYGVDVFLAGLARGLIKPIRSLETPESQAGLLVSDDPAETARSVGDLLDELEGGKGRRILQRLAGDWQRATARGRHA